MTLLLVSLIFLRPNASFSVSKTIVADALDWYLVWLGQSAKAARVQTCQGELLDNRYEFRCDPLEVVVDALFNDSGRCAITSMRPSISPADGTRLRPVPRAIIRIPHEECGELPINKRYFKVLVTPHSRMFDADLSAKARAAALAYMERGGDRSCLVRVAKVKTGDPFVHVYEECQGVLDAVLEFAIEQGRVADFPHWTFDQAHKDIPSGADSRRKQTDLWFAVSRPEERKQPAR